VTEPSDDDLISSASRPMHDRSLRLHRPSPIAASGLQRMRNSVIVSVDNT